MLISALWPAVCIGFPNHDNSILCLIVSNTEFPSLPECPGGLSAPGPPATVDDYDAGKQPSTIDGSGVSEGSGKHEGMLLIPAGPFRMGSASDGRPDEKPEINVHLRGFYIAKNDVTVGEFCNFINQQGLKSRDGFPRTRPDFPDSPIIKTGKSFRPREGFENLPVNYVSWYAAQEYAQWAGGRLPTSAEWEKAALMTAVNPPPDSIALGKERSLTASASTSEGLKGMKGMTGLFWQWCADWYASDYYSQAPAANPPGPSLGQEKNIRGGSWASATTSTRIRNRHRADPRGCYPTVGFRIVKDL